MIRKDKIKQIRKLAGVTTHLSWSKLCSLTDFDSFATAFCYGINWNENCPNNRIVCMSDNYLNMIQFNLVHFPKDNTTPSPQAKDGAI